MKFRLALGWLLSAVAFGQAPNYLGPIDYKPEGIKTVARFAASELPSSGLQAPPDAVRLDPVSADELQAAQVEPDNALAGLVRPLPADIQGQWDWNGAGQRVWRAAVVSPGAAGIRIHLRNFHTGAGTLWIHDGGQQILGPFSGDGPGGAADFWTATIAAERVLLEYLPEDPGSAAPAFEAVEAGHLLSGPDRRQFVSAAASCHVDVSCDAAYGPAAQGVGLFYFVRKGVMYSCTGSLVNNRKGDLRPLFLTANHCVDSQEVARTVEVIWQYQSSSCDGQPPPVADLPRSIGAQFLAGAPIPAGDYTLLQLNQLPAIPLRFYGWDAGEGAIPQAASAVAISHPAGSWKRIAYTLRESDAPAAVGNEFAGADQFYRMLFRSGRVEAGSSGSPLFSAPGVIAGTLSYGPTAPACSIEPFVAGYGRFSRAMAGLGAYLNPGPGTAPADPAPAPAAAARADVFPSALALSVLPGGSAAPLERQLTVNVSSDTPAAITVSTDVPWLEVSPKAGFSSKSRPLSVQVRTANPSVTSALGSYQANVVLTPATGPPLQVPVLLSVRNYDGPPVTPAGTQIIPHLTANRLLRAEITLSNPGPNPLDCEVAFLDPDGFPRDVLLATPGRVRSLKMTLAGFGARTIATSADENWPQGAAAIRPADPARQPLVTVRYTAYTAEGAARAVTGFSPLASRQPVLIPSRNSAESRTSASVVNLSDTSQRAVTATWYAGDGKRLSSRTYRLNPRQQVWIDGSVQPGDAAGVPGSLVISPESGEAIGVAAFEFRSEGLFLAVPPQSIRN